MNVISLFCGIGGLDIGFREEGFNIILGIDIDKYAIETSKLNYPETEFWLKDLREVEYEDLKNFLELKGLSFKDIDVIIGGPPCQSFSTGGKRLGPNDKRKTKGGDLIYEFLRIVNIVNPPIFVLENVKGLLSTALQHISFYKRLELEKQRIELPFEYQKGSFFKKLLSDIEAIGYKPFFKVLNAADYGSPQKRERLFIVGVRKDINVEFKFPSPTHGNPEKYKKEISAGLLEPWVTLKDAIADLKNQQHEFLNFPPSWGKYMQYIPEGGCWINLPSHLQKEVLKGAYDDPNDPEKYGKKGGRRGFLRRLAWDKPSPTLLTSPVMKGSVLGHPDENRPLSVQEYIRLQGFPQDFKIVGSTRIKYKLLGEAVPIPLSKAIAKAVKNTLKTIYTLHK
ncbi:MAG: DNA cytosine methyltransferase [Nautiliaceae bacterium]